MWLHRPLCWASMKGHIATPCASAAALPGAGLQHGCTISQVWHDACLRGVACGGQPLLQECIKLPLFTIYPLPHGRQTAKVRARTWATNEVGSYFSKSLHDKQQGIAGVKGGWQWLASHCPGSYTVMKGERNALRATDALKHKPEPKLLTHSVLSRSTPESCLVTSNDHKMMPSKALQVVCMCEKSGLGKKRRRKIQPGKRHGYKGGCSVLWPHFQYSWLPCPLVQDWEKHYHSDRQNELIFQTRQFKLHCRMFLLLVTSYHYDLFYGLNNMNMILSLEQVIESSWRLVAHKILSYHNNKATFYLTKVFSASIQRVHA